MSRINGHASREALRAVFTADVMEKLQLARSPSENLRWRINVLQACGPMPSNPSKRIEVRAWRAQKAAWESYVTAAFAVGFFEGAAGADLRSRLTDVDDNNFRGAMAECMAAYVLMCRLHLQVARVPTDRTDGSLDMQVQTHSLGVGVEVKAPQRERPKEGGWQGDESDKIMECVTNANKKFADDRPNLLVIVPTLRTAMYADRGSLVRALFARSVLCWTVWDDARSVGFDDRSWTELRHSGRFLNTTSPKGKRLKADGLPAYRRISAVICIEEDLVHKCPDPFPTFLVLSTDRHRLHAYWPVFERQRKAYFAAENESWITHKLLILHNPNAYHGIPADAFGAHPQFVPRDDVMVWTDGYECAV